MINVTKAVIPAAGFGTRLLPATKALPKELLPIINIPTLQHIVQEAADSGIKELLIIISKGKEAIKNHFTKADKLEKELIAKNKIALLEEVRKSNNLLKIKYVYQDKQLGLGHAIGCAKQFANKQPIAVLLGDDVVVSNGKTALSQCIESYRKTGCSIVGVQPVDKTVINKYGIIKPKGKQINSSTIYVDDLIEKPNPKDAPSNLAILGRYVLTPDIFDAIEKTQKDKSGEIQITNALKLLAKKSKVCACKFKGTRYDLGNKLGIVKATVDFALNDPELKNDVIKFIRSKR